VADPIYGASAERTRLAWRRTALSTTPVALLAIRLAVRDGVSLGGGLAIVAATVGWLAALWLTQRRIRAMASQRPRDIGRTLPAIALVTAGFAVLGVVLVLRTI
jgi:uncharacterized membrane protein YidH (DUF202 family)